MRHGHDVANALGVGEAEDLVSKVVAMARVKAKGFFKLMVGAFTGRALQLMVKLYRMLKRMATKPVEKLGEAAGRALGERAVSPSSLKKETIASSYHPEGENPANREKRKTTRSSRSDIKYRQASEVNSTFPAEWEPPYKPGTKVIEFTNTQDEVFVRVHGETNKARSWMMKKEAIEGLKPMEIKSKYALPELPDYISEVHVPAGTRIRSGKVNPVFGGQGNAKQYELLQRLPESVFKNTKRIK